MITLPALAGAASTYRSAVWAHRRALNERRTQKHLDKTGLALKLAERDLEEALAACDPAAPRPKAPLGTDLAIRLLGERGRTLLGALAVACVQQGGCRSPKSREIPGWHRPTVVRMVEAGLMTHATNGHCGLTKEGWALVPEACPELLHVLDEANPDYALDRAADDLDALGVRRIARRIATEWSAAHPPGTRMIRTGYLYTRVVKGHARAVTLISGRTCVMAEIAHPAGYVTDEEVRCWEKAEGKWR
jgi:hypothetical protein